MGFRTLYCKEEDGQFTDEFLVDLIQSIKQQYPDCAITLSLGERSYDSYTRLYQAGADRYLLRHETASAEHYRTLHPKNLSLEHRINCLNNLKEIGYQVGTGLWWVLPTKPKKIWSEIYCLSKNSLRKWWESVRLSLIMIRRLQMKQQVH